MNLSPGRAESSEATITSALTKLLMGYFGSGWAFLVPYLGVFCIYDWQHWPVHPTPASSGVPSLLHVFWLLHGIHCLFLLLAVRTRWRTGQDPLAEKCSRQLRAAAPWFLVALALWIPGAYFEWPSDPWEHLRRIREWELHHTIGAHSAGYKTFYFFAYSLIGKLEASSGNWMVDAYEAGVGLLLLWQYYRLGRAAGLAPQWATSFVLLNLLLFGNTTFSFYRYYGLGSTLFAQICAVAITRIVLTAALQATTAVAVATQLRKNLVAVALLGALISVNHLQGLAIAGLAMGSICIWWIARDNWRRLGWTALGLLGLSVAVVAWWPRHPLVDSLYRKQGWLSPWYAFDFSPDSPATAYGMQVLGALGLLNLAAGAWLVRRNHPVGWLTLGPVVAFLVPAFALPFASVVAGRGAGDIVTFPRLWFAVPSGLALACCLAGWSAQSTPGLLRERLTPFSAVILLLAAMTALAGGAPVYNRLWHLCVIIPEDLRLGRDVAAIVSAIPPGRDRSERPLLASSDGLHNVFSTVRPGLFDFRERPIYFPSTHSLDDAVLTALRPAATEHRIDSGATIIAAPPAQWRFTPASQAAQLAHHWPPQQVVSDFAGGPELQAAARKTGAQPRGDLVWIRLDSRTPRPN